MRKFVAENIEEVKEWVSSDTGFELYAEPADNGGDMNVSDLSDEDIQDLIPPPGFKFNPASFSEYVDTLIEAIPENPVFVAKAFDAALKQHPYLTQRGVGFKQNNPFEASIQKFIQALRSL